MPLDQIASNAAHPGRLVHPRRVQRSGTLTLQFASYDPTATYSTLYFSLLGFKVYANNIRVG